VLHRSFLFSLFLVAAAGLAEYTGSYIVPQDHDAILYSTRATDDAVTRLQARLAAGEKKLPFNDANGYLLSVLEALSVPVESQVLVFSKTSFQAPRIAPRTPRALYFNDSVSVGWVRGGDVLELAAVDPAQGTIFYTLDQNPAGPPQFVRRDSCLQCHASPSTVGVPGFLVRSVYPEPTGMPMFRAGSFVTDHRSPFKERWGGWYVSGTHGAQAHMGNSYVRPESEPVQLDSEGAQNLTDLSARFDAGAWLSPHSDIVALMVLEHQARMTNLITRVGWETRMALHSQEEMNRILERPAGELSESAARRINSGVEELLGYMLFTDEIALEAPVEGTSGFAEVFASAGLKDKRGRSLRDFDMKTRMFRHPCSYLIYSEAFDALPAAAKQRTYWRLHEILTASDPGPKYARLSRADRNAIYQILLETKKGLPDYWRAATL
jgi:hypothetical protein